MGDEIFLLGLPGGASEAHLSTGRVATIPSKQLLKINVSAIGGSSGSPVLSKDHKVIAVLRGGMSETFNVAVPITYIWGLIEKNRPYLEQINKLSYEDAVKRFGLLGVVYSTQESLNKDLLDASSLRGDFLKVKSLLEMGADVNAQDRYGMTALMLASVSGHQELVATLVRARADVNAQDKNGWTAVMWAITDGHQQIVATLVRVGADVNAQDKDGFTALMVASSWGRQEIVAILLRAGADVNAKNKKGETALTLAKSERIVKMLKKHSARLPASKRSVVGRKKRSSNFKKSWKEKK